jgi:DNA (cytosine-5)-methyltransferase 1
MRFSTPGTHGLDSSKHVREAKRSEIVTHNGGKLNPDWVEWLMGWPIGWTDLRPLAMDKFLPWLSQLINF